MIRNRDKIGVHLCVRCHCLWSTSSVDWKLEIIIIISYLKILDNFYLMYKNDLRNLID